MELNEVKIGDKVTFKNKGKKVVGKVIHRHDERKSPHLYGHVNVQKIGGSPSYPITIHISKLQPMLEETHMADFREDIKSMLQDIIDGNNVHANATFEVLLQQKIAELVDLAKVEVAGAMFSTQTEEVEQMDEVITKKTATGDVIRDFVHSKNSRFKGKSKKERIRMALGAKYSMMKEALVGGQKKLDMNHNNKLDAQDFKIIRKKKK